MWHYRPRVTPLLIISGPVGVGKTAVAGEIGELLEEQRIPHTVVDLDGLTRTYPRPDDDPFGNRLAIKNLEAVWTNCAAAGSRNLIVARVVESTADVQAIREATGGNPVVVCRLRASEHVLIDRVRQRERGSAFQWHVDRTIELARSLDRTGPGDAVIDTDHRDIHDIAREAAALVDWAGQTPLSHTKRRHPKQVPTRPPDPKR